MFVTIKANTEEKKKEKNSHGIGKKKKVAGA
jgi:hypothetical protein